MEPLQFDALKHFTMVEVAGTGANIEDVNPRLMRSMDSFREMFGSPVRLLRNGMTSGVHSAVEHALGLACDFTIDNVKRKDIAKVIATASAVGFRGLGIYRNGIGAYSFHVDLRDKVSLWGGTKLGKGGRWTYGGLTVKLGNK